MNRRNMAVATVGLVVIASAGGWLAGSRIQSPAEAAASVAPPVASPILVPAEERLLSTRIVTRGTARFTSPRLVTVMASRLKANGGIVSSVPEVGAELAEGTVAMTASGRPLFVLEGSVPTYRDLGPGLHGDDVLQLEEALVRLGHEPGPIDGIYDEATGTAVTDWYQVSGWEPFGATPEQLTSIRLLESDSAKIKGEQLAANDAIAAADVDLATAQAAAAAAREASSLADDLVSVAEAEAEAADQIAATDVASMRDARDRMAADLASNRGQGAVVTTARPFPSQDAPSAKLGPSTTSADLAAAESDLVAATNAAEATRLSGATAVKAARNEATDAQRRIEIADASVDAAALRATSARLLLTYLDGPASQLSAELAQVRLRAGTQVPADEMVFLPSVPVRVEQARVSAGDQVAGPVFTVTGNQLAIDTSLPLDEAPLLRTGMPVTIDEPSLGLSGSGVVGRVSDTPGTDGVDGFHVYAEILVEDAPESIVGTSVRLTIPIESTGGVVLAVPISALSLAADGSSRVHVQRAGVLTSVAVKPGLVADGYVAVTTADGSLQVGDLVVIGFDEPVVTSG